MGNSYNLTERELEILQLVVNGVTDNKSIARKLVISKRTVERHFANIYSKMGVSSQVQAVTKALNDGFLDLYLNLFADSRSEIQMHAHPDRYPIFQLALEGKRPVTIEIDRDYIATYGLDSLAQFGLSKQLVKFLKPGDVVEVYI